MRARSAVVLAIFASFAFLLTLPLASAHVPSFAGGGDSPETAPHIHDPLKSWAIYDELHEGGEAHYFLVEMEEGQRLYVMLYTPDKEFTPGLVVMGPGIESNGTVPAYVEVPDGLNACVLEGERNGAEYEPFTPASYYYLAEFDETVNTSGDYYVAVFEPDHGGKFGIAIGYIEEFSLSEWISVPFDTMRIHMWEGQSPVIILSPLIATVIVGLVLLIRMRDRFELERAHVWRWVGIIAALLYIGTAFVLFTQMFIALSISGGDSSASVTLLFAVIPLLLGIGIIRIVLKSEDLTLPSRIFLLILGVVGIFLWAGLLVGPILAFVTALYPQKPREADVQEDAELVDED